MRASCFLFYQHLFVRDLFYFIVYLNSIENLI